MKFEFDINFNGKYTCDLFGISLERCEKLIKYMADISDEITDEYKEYAVEYIENGKTKEKMFQGKMLQRFLRDLDDSQDKILVMMLFASTLEVMQRKVALQNAISAQQRLFNRKFESNDTN